MKAWDIAGGAARLEEAYENLRRAWNDVAEHWTDHTSQEFRSRHLDPLAPRVRGALDAIRRVDELFLRAHGALADRDRGED